MSRSAVIRLDFGPGEQTFRLPIAQLEELQEARDCGPLVLLARLQGQQWRTQDITETIRLGLIGGGMDPMKALAMVRRYVTDRPDPEWFEAAKIAEGILGAALIGVEDEPLGKTEGETETPPSRSPEESGGSLPSTEPPASSTESTSEA